MGLLNGLGFSQLINGKSRVLGEIYARTYSDLIREMNDFSRTPWQRQRAMTMLARVDESTKHLEKATKAFIDKEVPATYFATAKAVQAEVNRLGIKQLPQFGQIHYQAIEAAASDAMAKFGHTMIGIKRSVEDVARFSQQKAVREIIAAGDLRGAAAKEIAKEVQAKIREDGITVLIDKGGKQWQLDTYAEMLTRQVLANSGREGISNTALELGFDLAEITTHGTTCELCMPWEGVIVSLTGKTPGYPSLDKAKEEGLMHVGCKHGFTIVSFVTRPKPFDPQRSVFEDVRVGDQDINVLDGHFYRTMDAKEYGYMLNTGQLAPTPHGLFEHGATDNRKYFGSDPALGQSVERNYAGTGQSFTIAVPVSAMPAMKNDPQMLGQAVYVTQPIPVSKIRLVK